MKRDKLVVIAEEFPPNVTGGLGAHYEDLVPELAQHFDVEVICAAPGGPERVEKKGKFTVHHISVPKMFPLNHVFFEIKAARLARKIKHKYTHLCVPFGFLHAFLSGNVTCAKYHTAYASQNGGIIYRHIIFPIAARIDRLIARRAKHIITTSEFMREDLHKRLGISKNRITAIPNGVDKRFFVTPAKNRTKNIIYVGRLVERKGALQLVKAMKTIVAECPEATLIVVGEGFTEGGDYAKEVRKEVDKLQLQKHIKFVGWVDRSELLKLYQQSYVLVHPATYEPFGNIIVEAMAAGIPVIVSKAGGPEYIVEKSGIVLPNNNPDKLSKAVIQLLQDKKRHSKLSTMARTRAKQFTWSACAKAEAKVIEDEHENS